MGFTALPISAEHAGRAPALPAHHRDPLDSMLVARPQLESLSVLTAASALRAYDVEFVDARR